MEQAGIVSVFVVAIAAFVAWVVAAISALEIIRLAPRGGKLATYWKLGWWRHGELAAELGPPANAPLRRYRLAFYAFFACVLGTIAAIFLLTLSL